MIQLVRSYDVAQNVIGQDELGGPRALDLANAIVLLAPLALLIPALLAGFGRALPRRAEILPAVMLLAALLALSCVVHPLQGMVRDWDVIAPAAWRSRCVAAWLVGETLSAAPRAVARARGGPRGDRASVQWLVHLGSAPHALARVEAVLREPPARSSSSARGDRLDRDPQRLAR